MKNKKGTTKKKLHWKSVILAKTWRRRGSDPMAISEWEFQAEARASHKTWGGCALGIFEAQGLKQWPIRKFIPKGIEDLYLTLQSCDEV